MNQLLPSRAGILSYPVRLSLFGLFTFATFFAIYFASMIYSTESLSAENGPLELLQVVFVGSATIMFFYAALKSNRGRANLALMGSLAGYATAKELDSLFEMVLFDDAYKYVAAIPLILITAAIIWFERATLLRDTPWIMKQRTTTLFTIGGVYLICVCQLLDSPAFWGVAPDSAGFETGVASGVKQMVEEFCEVFAYVMVAFAGVEAVALAFRQRKAESMYDSDSSEDASVSIVSFETPVRRAA